MKINKDNLYAASATSACLLLVPYILLPVFFLLQGSSSTISEVGFFILAGTLFLFLTIATLICFMFLLLFLGFGSEQLAKAILLVLFYACVNATFLFGSYGVLNGSPLDMDGNGLIVVLQILFLVYICYFYLFLVRNLLLK